MKLINILRTLFLTLFIGTILILIVFESAPGKRWVERQLLQALAKSELPIKVESLSGNIPYHIIFKNVQAEGMSAEKVEIDFSLIWLLKRELYIKSLQIEGLHLSDALKSQSTTPSPSSQLPITITVHSFSIQGDLDLKGKAKFRRHGSGYVEVDIHNPTVPTAFLHANASWNSKKLFEMELDLSTPSLKAFAPWMQTEAEGSLRLQGNAAGHLDDYSGNLSGNFNATQLPWDYLQTDWNLKSRFNKTKNGPFEFQRILASSENLRIQGSLNLTEEYHFNRAEGQIRADLPQGLIFATSEVTQGPTGLEMKGSLRSDFIKIEKQSIKQAAGSISGSWINDTFIGTTNVSGKWLQEVWEATSPITFQPNVSLLFEDIQLHSALLQAHGNLSFKLPTCEPTGNLSIEQIDLRLLHLATGYPFTTGTATGTLSFDDQGLKSTITAKEIQYDASYTNQATITYDSGDIDLHLSQFRFKQLVIEEASAHLTGPNFTLTANGALRDPLQVHLNGQYERKEEAWQVTLSELNGLLFTESFALEAPTTLAASPGHLSLSPFALQFGSGLMLFELQQNPSQTDILLSLNQVPLDLLSLNPLEVPIQGKISVEGALHERNGTSTGEIKARIEDGLLVVEGGNEEIQAEGTFQATLQNDRLKGKTAMIVNQEPFLTLDCDLPFVFEPRPFSLQIPLHKQAEGHLSLHGRIEEITDFFNLGTHRIEGNIDCELAFKGKLDKPRLKGYCEITDGLYQNYLTGTDISDITATLISDKEQLILKSLHGIDGKEGSLHATGELKMLVAKHFPFTIDATISNLALVQLDLVSALAEGKLSIQGDSRAATIKGNVEITESQASIPDQMPRSFPELHVVYKNAPYKPVEKKKLENPPYPLHLDLNITAPKSIFISGRGLNSEWKGNFAIGGTFISPAAVGKLELLQGEFVFAGKAFKLIDGSLALQGKAYDMPIIDITAQTAEKGISITSQIKGPVNSPQITFQSVPPLPLSAIISYLIFGKDLSEVSGIQALQLASTIASVAGEGADILEMTRKSLGVDRLQIVMTPSSIEEGGETLSLEVGKVIFPGFLVLVRQGAEDSSPNIGVEVDLTHGFTLGIESQQQPEQGKFSLNWNINY